MSFWTRHQVFEKNSIILIVGILAVIAIGGLVEITPLFYLKSTIEVVDGIRPYTPLELTGRNIYVREGCYLCHSQMILVPQSVMPGYPFLAETEVDTATIGDHLRTSRAVGVPYSDDQIANAVADLKAQADPDNAGVDAFTKRYPKAVARNFDGKSGLPTEMDALIAYLQMLGTLVDFKLYNEKANLR